MSQDPYLRQLPAPCIIDCGTVINKDDIYRLLSDLGKVKYIHSLDGQLQSEGEGWIVEVFSDTQESTLIANGSLYLNVYSFDYLKLERLSDRQPYFDLVQDNRQLRLIPLEPYQPENFNLPVWDRKALEQMVVEVLAAEWDVQIDDDHTLE